MSDGLRWIKGPIFHYKFNFILRPLLSRKKERKKKKKRTNIFFPNINKNNSKPANKIQVERRNKRKRTKSHVYIAPFKSSSKTLKIGTGAVETKLTATTQGLAREWAALFLSLWIQQNSKWRSGKDNKLLRMSRSDCWISNWATSLHP